MEVNEEYMQRLKIKLNMACHPVSTAQTLENQLNYAYSMATTKTDEGLIQRDKSILMAFLGCVGYEFVNGRMRPKTHSGDMIYGENLLKSREIENTIFEFSDDNSNLSVIAYYVGDDLHFSATNNFIKADAPWYARLPMLEAAFNVQENTFWFMYRPHCLVAKLDKDKKFKACRITDLLNALDDDTDEIETDNAIALLDKEFDPELTVEVLSKEIEPEEKYGLPDLFEGLKKLGVL